MERTSKPVWHDRDQPVQIILHHAARVVRQKHLRCSRLAPIAVDSRLRHRAICPLVEIGRSHADGVAPQEIAVSGSGPAGAKAVSAPTAPIDWPISDVAQHLAGECPSLLVRVVDE